MRFKQMSIKWTVGCIQCCYGYKGNNSYSGTGDKNVIQKSNDNNKNTRIISHLKYDQNQYDFLIPPMWQHCTQSRV